MSHVSYVVVVITCHSFILSFIQPVCIERLILGAVRYSLNSLEINVHIEWTLAVTSILYDISLIKVKFDLVAQGFNLKTLR